MGMGFSVSCVMSTSSGPPGADLDGCALVAAGGPGRYGGCCAAAVWASHSTEATSRVTLRSRDRMPQLLWPIDQLVCVRPRTLVWMAGAGDGLVIVAGWSGADGLGLVAVSVIFHGG